MFNKILKKSSDKPDEKSGATTEEKKPEQKTEAKP